MKRRREFEVHRYVVSENEGEGTTSLETLVATGVLYDEGNVQVLWRKDIGDTAEQYANISQVIGIVLGANRITILDEV